MIRHARALVHAWLVLDFFEDTRRTGEGGSSLTSTVFTQSFVGLIIAALIFEPRSVGVVPFAAANLTLSTLLVGIGGLGAAQRSERTLADRVLTATAPITRTTLPLARVLHGAFHLGIVTIGAAIPPAILCAFFAPIGPWIVPLYLAVAVLLAGMLAGALALATRALARWAGAHRAALFAGSAKAALLGGGLVGFAICLRHLDDTADALPFGRVLASAWPPYWGARWLAAPLTDGALWGVALVGLGATLFAVSTALGDSERRRGGARPSGRSFLGAIERRLSGGGALYGLVAFTSTMLFRSPGFRARVLPLFGMPAAMVLMAFLDSAPTDRLLLLGVAAQFPAIYLPFLVLFLPMSDDRGNDWLFRTGPHDALALSREGALISLSVRILGPVHLAAAILTAACGFGLLPAVALSAFSWGIAVHLLTLVLRRLEHVPFTAGPDGAEALEFGSLLAIALLLAVLGGGFALLADGPVGAVVALAAAGSAWLRLRRSPDHVESSVQPAA